MGKVEFFLSCSDLNSAQAFIGVFIKDPAKNSWVELGRTAVVYNNNPKFAHQFVLPYIFEEEQRVRCTVVRSVNGDTAYIPQNVIGAASFKLSEVVHAKRMICVSLANSLRTAKSQI